MALSFQEADGCNSVWYVAQCRMHIALMTMCIPQSHTLCLAVILDSMLCGRIQPCKRSLCYPQQANNFSCTWFSSGLTGMLCQLVTTFACIAASICAQHVVQCASNMTALPVLRHGGGVLGCRRQIVEVQSHDYDKHPDAESHFSNGEHRLMTSVQLLGPASTARLVSWPLHFKSCQCQLSIMDRM